MPNFAFRTKVALWAAASLAASPAPAQVGLLTPPVASGPTLVDLNPFTARAITRVALLDLRAVPTPLPADYGIAHELLGLAEALAPDDAEIVRRRIETAWNAGDHEAVVACTARLVRLDPADTVAQLRLITSRLGRLQTVHERLEAYAQFLGPRGSGLDASVRSRLALDAALLAREIGDDARFVSWLKEAMRLDATNKDAALLALNFHNARSDDLRARFELLSNLLLADPLDPRTVRSLRDECAAAGAIRAALRFHRLEKSIADRAGMPQDASFESEGFILNWLVDGSEPVVKTLTTQVEAERAKVRFADQMDPTRQDAPNAMRPEDIRLDLPFEQTRALALHRLGDDGKDRLQAVVIEMELTVQNKLQGFGDPLRRPANMTEAQALETGRDMLLELHFFRMLIGYESSEQVKELDALLEDIPAADVRAAAGARWKAIAESRYADATAEPGPTERSLWVRLAQAEALARGGDTAKAGPLFAGLAREFALTSMGGWCRLRAADCLGEREADPDAVAIQSLADAVPAWVDNFPEFPRQVVSLHVDAGRAKKAALDHEPTVLTLRNVAPVAMGLGSARSINSRLFFGPSLEIGIRSRGEHTAGEVIELDRRLRLLPGEALVAKVTPEIGMVGYLQELGADKPSRLRWRVIQGFETRQTGAREPGPGCLEAGTSTYSREALPEARLDAGKLAERIASATDATLPALLVAVRCKVLGGEVGGTPDPASPALAAAVVAAYPNWSPTGRLLAAAVLPSAAVAPPLVGVDDLLRADADPRVRLVYALTHAASADDAALRALQADPDAGVAAAAKRHAERLAANVQTLSRVGPRGAPVKTPK